MALSFSACNSPETEALHEAIKRGNLDEVRAALDAGANPDQCYSQLFVGHHYCPLVQAVQNGQDDIVRLLLEREADPDIEKDGLGTPLTVATRKKDYPIMTMLLNAGADPNLHSSSYGWPGTPLKMAASNGDTKAIGMLLKVGADVHLKAVRKYGSSALMHALKSGNVDAVHMLLNAGAKLLDQDNEGRTTLVYAIGGASNSLPEYMYSPGDTREANLQLVNLLLDEGADLYAKDKKGNTILVEAGCHSPAEVVQLLLDRGLTRELNTPGNRGITPLLCSIRSGNEEAFAALIDAGADTETKNARGETPLFRALRNSNPDFFVEKLLTRRTEVNRREDAHLHNAAFLGHENVVTLLFDIGKADPQLIDLEGNTALMWAVRYSPLRTSPSSPLRFPESYAVYYERKEAIINLLVKNGVDLKTRNNLGNTVLIEALRQCYDHDNIIRHLLSFKEVVEEINAQNLQGDTALITAMNCHHKGHAFPKILALLLDAGADAGIANHEGQTALTLTQQWPEPRQEIINLLKDTP